MEKTLFQILSAADGIDSQENDPVTITIKVVDVRFLLTLMRDARTIDPE